MFNRLSDLCRQEEGLQKIQTLLRGDTEEGQKHKEAIEMINHYNLDINEVQMLTDTSVMADAEVQSEMLKVWIEEVTVAHLNFDAMKKDFIKEESMSDVETKVACEFGIASVEVCRLKNFLSDLHLCDSVEKVGRWPWSLVNSSATHLSRIFS